MAEQNILTIGFTGRIRLLFFIKSALEIKNCKCPKV